MLSFIFFSIENSKARHQDKLLYSFFCLYFLGKIRRSTYHGCLSSKRGNIVLAIMHDFIKTRGKNRPELVDPCTARLLYIILALCNPNSIHQFSSLVFAVYICFGLCGLIKNLKHQAENSRNTPWSIIVFCLISIETKADRGAYINTAHFYRKLLS